MANTESVSIPPQDSIIGADAASQLEIGIYEPAQGYEYTRQDGTIEHAASLEDAFKLCPVLGKLAMTDPEAAKLLLEVASIGHAKMAEEAKRTEPKAPQKEPDAKRDESEKSIVIQEENVALPDGAITKTEETQPQKIAEEIVVQNSPVETQPLINKSEKIHTARIVLEQSTQKVEPITVDETIYTQHKREVVKDTVFRQATEVPTNLHPSTSEEIVQTNAAIETSQFLTDTEQVQIVEQAVTEWAEEHSPMKEEAALFDIQTEPISLKAEFPYEFPEAEAMPTELEMPMDRGEELSKDPVQIYKDFCGDLLSIVVLSREQPEFVLESEMTPGNIDGPNIAEKKQEAIDLPEIAHKVSQRISELTGETKEKVAPVLVTIVDSIQVIRKLVLEEAEPEAIEAIESVLEETVIQLFEQLSIDYKKEDIGKFISILFRPEFLAPLKVTPEFYKADLENEGTHEAKYHFPLLFRGLLDTEDKVQDFIGKITLFYFLKPARNLITVLA